jgi:glycosyltransferase involved in cell wall biosynthesis
MRVTHVITRLIVGGAQENTLASVLGLRALPGFEVELISGPTTGPEGSLESRASAVPGLLTLAPSLVRPVHPWKDLRAWRQLSQRFRATRPDLVHTHSGKAGLIGRLAARTAGVPLIVHGIHGPSFGRFQGRIANAAFLTAERLAGRLTTHFVVVANAMTRQYLAAGIGRPSDYTCIRSGFDLSPFLGASNEVAVRKKLGLSPADLVVGMVARLFKLKGHDELFAVAPELVRRCPRMKFLLVGDGPWRARFEARARAADLDGRFVFAGLVPPEEVPALVGVMDILLHLSRREGLPRCLPQAMAAGRPVVASDCDGAGEVCLNDETGFLIPLDDSVTLIARLLQLAGDPGLRQRLGEGGKRVASREFAISTLVAAQASLYRRLQKQATRPSP